jgi:glycerol-3-phosphate dehydrogenase (NAD(P)+)
MSRAETAPLGVLGGGAWGTALAQVAARGGHPVTLWAYEAEVVTGINADRENPLFLPGVPLHGGITATSRLDDLAGSEAVLLVCPAQHVRRLASQLAHSLPATVALVICAKGIEQGTGLLMTEVVAEVAPGRPIAVLSGPTFAKEVARGLPTAITLACADEALGRRLIQLIGQPAFRPYWSSDVIGAEIGGAVKNVLAIACGIAEGRKLGENAKASLIARGFMEMQRLGLAKGARPETLMGLSGLGDLILTCGSRQSRNMSLGVALGEGLSAAEALADKRTVAEGAHTAPVLAQLARTVGIDMPICAGVAAILSGAATVGAMIEALLSRPFRDEGV